MNHHEHANNVLPPDLAAVELYLRDNTTSASPALLARIVATREALQTRAGTPTPTLAPTILSQTTIRRRRRSLVVSAAVLTVVALSMPWIAEAPRPIEARSAGTPERSPYREDVTRLLQPFPASAQAQSPDTEARPRRPRATLVPTALKRLTLDARVITRIRRDVSGRELSRTRREVRLDTVQSENYVFWQLVSRGPLDSPIALQQIDSIVLDAKALRPLRRRIHAPGMAREFQFGPGSMVIADTIGSPMLWARPALSARMWTSPQPTPTTRRNFDHQHTFAVTEEHLALLLRTAPLTLGWTSTVSVPSPFEQVFQSYDASVVTVRVVQIDTVQTTKGPVPCYRVTIDYGQRPDIWWISVATGEFIRGVRTTADPVTTETTTLERVEPLRRERR